MFSLNPFESLIADVGWVNGLTGGVAGALLPPPFGTDTSIAPNAPGANAALTGEGNFWPKSIFDNFGIFCIGGVLLMAGLGFLIFAWGERLAGGIENVASKFPVVPV